MKNLKFISAMALAAIYMANVSSTANAAPFQPVPALGPFLTDDVKYPKPPQGKELCYVVYKEGKTWKCCFGSYEDKNKNSCIDPDEKKGILPVKGEDGKKILVPTFEPGPNGGRDLTSGDFENIPLINLPLPGQPTLTPDGDPYNPKPTKPKK